jgi:hypothetical protein
MACDRCGHRWVRNLDIYALSRLDSAEAWEKRGKLPILGPPPKGNRYGASAGVPATTVVRRGDGSGHSPDVPDTDWSKVSPPEGARSAIVPPRRDMIRGESLGTDAPTYARETGGYLRDRVPPRTVRIAYRRSLDDMERTFVFDPDIPLSIAGFVDSIRLFEKAALRTNSGKTATRSLDGLQAEVKTWTDVAFPHSTLESRTRHLIREMVEFSAHVWEDATQEQLEAIIMGEVGHALNRLLILPGSDMLEELADCLLVMCDIAANADPLSPHTTSLYLEAAAKLAKAKDRRYGSPDAAGVSEHIGGDE